MMVSSRLHVCLLVAVTNLSMASVGAWAAEATMSGMDHSQMPGMDHSKMQGMSHSQMQGMDSGMTTMAPSKPAAPTQSRTPIPPITDADRAAVYQSTKGHVIHDHALYSFLLFDQLEWQDEDNGSVLNWDVNGWLGGDIDRLWIRSKGERTNGKTESAELQTLWGRSISPWWDVVGGVRQDFKPGPPQTWAALGLQGLALYNFEVEATAFLGEGGQTSLRVEGDYDILLTNRLILQPTAEVDFYGQNDAKRGIGSGLSTTEVGMRLRYEIYREFAPYIGFSWNRSYGNTAAFSQEGGGDRSEARLVLGVRLWF